MRVDFHDFLNGRGFDKGGWDSFFNGKDGAFGGGDSDCGGSELLSAKSVEWTYFDGFHCVLDYLSAGLDFVQQLANLERDVPACQLIIYRWWSDLPQGRRC
jgi:hypothetical protein